MAHQLKEIKELPMCIITTTDSWILDTQYSLKKQTHQNFHVVVLGDSEAEKII